MAGSLEDDRVGLAAPALGYTTRSCLDLRATAAASLAPEASWVPVLVELGGLAAFAVMVAALELNVLPDEVCDVNFGIEEVFIVIDFSCCPVGDCGFISNSSVSSLAENSDGVGSFSIRTDCLSWIYPGSAMVSTSSSASGLPSASASGVWLASNSKTSFGVLASRFTEPAPSRCLPPH